MAHVFRITRFKYESHDAGKKMTYLLRVSAGKSVTAGGNKGLSAFKMGVAPSGGGVAMTNNQMSVPGRGPGSRPKQSMKDVFGCATEKKIKVSRRRSEQGAD